MENLLYNDGVDLEFTDLESDGFGAPYGQSRSWTNGPGYAAVSVNGTGMVDIDQPHLDQVNGNNTVAVITSGTDALYFDFDPASGTRIRWHGPDAVDDHDPSDHRPRAERPRHG